MAGVWSSIVWVWVASSTVHCLTILKPGSSDYDHGERLYQSDRDEFTIDDVITTDGVENGHIDLDWDVIQQEKDQLPTFYNIFDDVITDLEQGEGRETFNENIFQAAEETALTPAPLTPVLLAPVPALNLHAMAVVDSELFRKFLRRNQRDITQTHNAIVLYFSQIFAMVSTASRSR
uniref:Uncharacterized protein LOC111130496 n=1 Tax=Crassostrea virginica TaxID=6565 RepID=A0A8B8E0K6_CRAVI|nr:uncharacterized protein LOC111130496 [Crassostrea virginica]